MKIAVLSGKGGAGKTMVAVNLAVTAGKATYIDCDVEEPNGRLFLKPEGVKKEPVYALLPDFDSEKCTGCRQCVKHCRFHALIYIKEKPQVFSEVCHSCGLCSMVCPEGAIREVPKTVGQVEIGMCGETTVVTGVLNPGEASGVPVIHGALRHADPCTTVIDCPPGSACSVMESIEDADYCVLVAEPTAFGFHNFKMVHTLAVLLEKPCGVVVNKMEASYGPLEQFCQENRVPILARIPYTEAAAKAISGGQIVSRTDEKMAETFRLILEKIGGRV